jgi:hypothetical protein
MRILILLVVLTLSCSAGLAQTQPSAANEESGMNAKGADSERNLLPEITVKLCVQAHVHDYFNEFATRLPPKVLTQSRQIARSPRTRSLIRLPRPDSDWLVQLRQYVNTQVKSMAGGQSGMDIEAIVYLVMMTVADDMENDLKDTLKNMKEIEKEKAAQRISKLREEICLFIEQREKAKK